MEFLNTNGIRVAAYLVAAGLCLVAARREQSVAATQVPSLWVAAGIVLALLGVARAVELGPIISDAGRTLAISDGWYENRREYQRPLVLLVLLAGAVAGLALVAARPRRFRVYLPTLLALGAVLDFVFVRAVSLHQVDTVLYRRDVAGLRIGTVVELGLVVVVCLALVWAIRRYGSASGPSA